MQQYEPPRYGLCDYTVDLDEVSKRVETNAARGVDQDIILKWAWKMLNEKIKDGVPWKLPDGTRATSEQFRRAAYSKYYQRIADIQHEVPNAEQLKIKI